MLEAPIGTSVKRLKWKLGLICLEIMLILMQDRCTVCMELFITGLCRAKRARANLIYLFAASVRPEETEVDMVTVRTVIKGSCR